ncbi:kelch repeat-containing protein [Sorangium sp. So ce119]|uniref:Kelch repeat-containing protein n=1 Tax=Sorangium sp. So ce119 TaxID=3133279 RepID=UPI003F5FCF17
MPIAGSTRHPGLRTLALFWTGVLAVLLGCSEIADPLDARALRRQFPEQADAILQGPFAFTAASGSFEPVRSFEAPEDRPGEAAPRPRFPMHGDGALRFPLPDGTEALVRELGAAGEAAVAENAVAYARRGGASFWTALEDGYEEWLLLDPSAVRRDAPVATWQVDGAALRQAGAAVELADARGTPQLRVTAPEAYAAGGRPVDARLVARERQLELWVDAEAETVLVDPRWKLKRTMSTPRSCHTATPLPGGRVLVVGGHDRDGSILDSAEIFDPISDTWLPAERMHTARACHTATELPDGRVLVTGGTRYSGDEPLLASGELFDPVSGAWSSVSDMLTARIDHIAVPLPDGEVLIAGGSTRGNAIIGSAEVLDLASGTWSSVGDMLTARTLHIAVPLQGGEVLVAGGKIRVGPGEIGTLSSAEVFDPATKAWRSTEPMIVDRSSPTATVLPDGRVLVTGGDRDEVIDGVEHGLKIDSAEVFDPASETWSPIPPMPTARSQHTASLLSDGRVLVAGGQGAWPDLDSAEVFDPASGMWRAVAPMVDARSQHTASLLPDGRVLVAGGNGDGSLASVEVFDPASSVWSRADDMANARHELTMTALPDGRVLAAGGYAQSAVTNSAEVFDPTSGTWSPADSMNTARFQQTATALGDGRVLVVGGEDFLTGQRIDSVEIFDPVSGVWRALASISARSSHTAALLSDGRVLITGGSGNETGLHHAEMFDPVSETWRSTGAMLEPRMEHTATLLLDGRVLVAGGGGDGNARILKDAEVFDPASELWVTVGTMLDARSEHTATRLLDGRVLVAGGIIQGRMLDSAEMFDPISGTWTPLAPMLTPRFQHTATLLSNGQVLVMGGSYHDMGIPYLDSAEVFDPASGIWRAVGSMLVGRTGHEAVPLPGGRVLVAGGSGYEGALTSAEIFSPMPNGRICAADAECQSGFCTDGVCCDLRCNEYLCEACSDHRGASKDGVCTSLHPDYTPFACSPRTGQATRPCQSVHDCAEGFVCDAPSGDCVPPPPARGYLDKGGCHLAARAAAGLPARGPLELGLLALAALAAALRRRGA